MIKLWFVPLDVVFPSRALIYPPFWGVLVVLDDLLVVHKLVEFVNGGGYFVEVEVLLVIYDDDLVV